MTKTLWGVLGALVAIGVIFCLVVVIMGGCHGLNFVEEIRSWFDTAKDVVPDPETVVTTVKTMLKI